MTTVSIDHQRKSNQPGVVEFSKVTAIIILQTNGEPMLSLDRRHFLHLAAGGILAGILPATAVNAGVANRSGFKAIAFDGFPIFDPRPIARLAESLFPGRGEKIMNVWRIRQFEYQWLRALSGQYTDFLQVTRDSLAFTSRQLEIEMSPEQHDQLIAAWSDLKVWPDAVDALSLLNKAGLRLCFLSNMTADMLEKGIADAGMRGMFEAVLSTDQVRSYKPDTRAYQLGVDALHLPKEEILFVAFAGWDVAGAKWFGYPTFWVNRLDSPMEEFGVQADQTGSDLNALVDYVLPGVRT